jgi:pimeloyl-ACP methyl ester carboxylesterase
VRRFILILCAWSIAILSAAALTQTSIETGTIETADKHQLFFEKRGHGPNVIIAPGRLFVAEGLDALSDEWTIITYDMRNRGLSSAVKDKSQISLEADLSDLETVRKHFGVEKAHFIGFSYLGMLVVLYANQHPDSVDRIVQLGPTPLVLSTKYDPKFAFEDPSAAAIEQLRATNAKLRQDGLHTKDPKAYCFEEANLNSLILVGNESRVSMVSGMVAGGCDHENEWPTNLGLHFNALLPSHTGLKTTLEELSKNVPHPVLTIHGTYDRNAVYGAGREWAHRLPNARLLTIEGAAHMAFVEDRERVLTAIRTFLRGDWPADAETVKESPVATQ